MEQFENQHDISLIKCGHIYHRDCLEKNEYHHHQCPTCKQKYNPQYQKYIFDVHNYSQIMNGSHKSSHFWIKFWNIQDKNSGQNHLEIRL